MGLSIPDCLHPVPFNLPAPVLYTGYSLTQWKKAMKLSGCDQMAAYQTTRRKNTKKTLQENTAIVAAALKAMETGQLAPVEDEGDEEVEVECEVTIVGAIRDKKGHVRVAVLWKDEQSEVTKEEWIPIGDLQNIAPGTENHRVSFGQEREGELIVVQWESTRRYVAELQTWNWEEDSFAVVYEAQKTNTSLKTSQTDRQTHSFRLDTLQTLDLKDTDHHNWWVCAKYASRPFISKMLKVEMGGNVKKVGRAAQEESDDSSSEPEHSDERPVKPRPKQPVKKGRACKPRKAQASDGESDSESDELPVKPRPKQPVKKGRACKPRKAQAKDGESTEDDLPLNHLLKRRR
jgi:hypothetical protein